MWVAAWREGCAQNCVFVGVFRGWGPGLGKSRRDHSERSSIRTSSLGAVLEDVGKSTWDSSESSILLRKHFVVQERCQFVGTSLLLRDCYCYRATSVCKTPWGTRIIPHVLQFGSGTRFPYLLDLAGSSHNPGRRKVRRKSVDFHGSPGLREFGKGFLPPSPLTPGQGKQVLKQASI